MVGVLLLRVEARFKQAGRMVWMLLRVDSWMHVEQPLHTLGEILGRPTALATGRCAVHSLEQHWTLQRGTPQQAAAAGTRTCARRCSPQ